MRGPALGRLGIGLCLTRENVLFSGSNGFIIALEAAHFSDSL